MMRLACLPLVLMLAAAAPPTQLARRCTGSETVQVGDQKPRKVPYALTFSVDLAARRYCYGVCGPEQTFPMPARQPSGRIVLAAFDIPAQARNLVFDPRSETLTDDLRIDFGLGSIVHRARATCKAAVFHQPPR